MIGKTISHYNITEKIGSGGMGIVYKAQDLKLDRFVALKFLPPHLTSSEDEKQRFIHEAKAVSSLDHNNICNIYEIDETEDGQLFISMACYEGETLDNKIKDKPLPIDEANDISIQIAQGLAKAHEKDIVHRDIKPANIMLTSDGIVKILDFGLAKLSTQTKLTKESTTLGTVSYMSPEQAKGEEVDYRTDIWSLGVMLYEMLTGQLPFKGEYESAVIYSILNDMQEPVTGLRTGMPMELERIINKCLQKNPTNRYQHVDELMVDLRSMKRESESTAIPTKEETQKKRSKSVRLSVAIISILILMVVGYLIIQPYWKNETEWESSIAVLPFDDLSPEGDQEWFCDGMTEQIITNLSKIKRLKVIGRTSIMKFKNTNKTLPEIGQELNVSHILEGSIRKHEDNIRVTAQLINTEDGSHLWADDFDRKLDDVFIVQDDVSEEIATILLATLSPQEKKSIKTKRPSNKEAYEYYMKGRYFYYNKFFSSFKKEDFLSSEKMFKRAIKLDPKFSDSYASLADLYNFYYNTLPDTSSDKSTYMQLQEAYLDTAYQLDPNSAEVNFAKGWVHDAKNEHEEAFDCFKNAIEINPNNDRYYFEIGIFLVHRGCINLAIKCSSKAIEINPLHQACYNNRGYWHLGLRDYDKAERDLIKAYEIDPNNFKTQFRYYVFLLTTKRYDEAEKSLVQMETNHPDEIWNDEYALLYAVKGQKENALNTFKSGFDVPAEWLYSILGMKDEVISLLQDQLEQHKIINKSRYLFLNNFTFYDNLRSDPRFQEILAKHKEIYEHNLAKYGDIEELLN